MQKEYRIGQNVSEKLIPIIVNEYEDKIFINIDDTTFVTKVINLYQWFDKKSVEIEKLNSDYQEKMKNIEANKDVAAEDLDIYKDFLKQVTDIYRDICERIDELFGEGTIKKYFRKLYEAYGDEFVPDDECIEDFIDEITPVIEQLFKIRKDNIRSRYHKKNKRSGSHG